MGEVVREALQRLRGQSITAAAADAAAALMAIGLALYHPRIRAGAPAREPVGD